MPTPDALEAVARAFLDAFNRRDAEGLIAVSEPDMEFHPSSLVGSRRAYHGHDGLRAWVADLGRSVIQHQARVIEVRVIDEQRFLLVSEVLVDGEPMSPGGMLGRVSERGRLAEARSYLSSEPPLEYLGLGAVTRRADSAPAGRRAPAGS